MRLEGKVAVITGAASGFGRAGAVRFAAEGARVVATDLDAAGLDETLALVAKAGGEGVAAVGDVTSAADNEAAVALAVDTYGGLDVMWANAGVPQAFRPITEIDPAEFDRIQAVNARGPWLGARAALPAMRARGGGSFVITASLSGLKARPDATAYQASKGAAVMLTKSLSREFAQYNVRVNSVCPLAAETPMWAKFMDNYMDLDEATKVFSAAVPLGRLATADDIANAALFLASDESSFVTGVNLPVDGGAAA